MGEYQTQSKGLWLTYAINTILHQTGVSLRHGRRPNGNVLHTYDMDIVTTYSSSHKQVEKVVHRYRARNPGRKFVVIYRERSKNPQVYIEPDTLIWLLCEAIKRNEAHWARPLTAKKDSDEGSK